MGGDNHTNTAALAHMVNTQYDAGNTCGLVETFLTTCMTSSDIFCKVYSIQAEEASKTYMGCDRTRRRPAARRRGSRTRSRRSARTGRSRSDGEPKTPASSGAVATLL